MERSIKVCAALAALALLGGCSYPGVVRLSADTYRVSRADPGHVFADTQALKQAAIDDANAFAHAKGMVAAPLAVREDTLQVGHLSTVDYEFRLVAAADAAPALPAAPTTAPVAASTAAAVLAAPPVPPPPQAPRAAKPDYYQELVRLDDLRKRGILTEDEFQTLKAKILSER